jgi:hypothetical protein
MAEDKAEADGGKKPEGTPEPETEQQPSPEAGPEVEALPKLEATENAGEEAPQLSGVETDNTLANVSGRECHLGGDGMALLVGLPGVIHQDFGNGRELRKLELLGKRFPEFPGPLVLVGGALATYSCGNAVRVAWRRISPNP